MSLAQLDEAVRACSSVAMVARRIEAMLPATTAAVLTADLPAELGLIAEILAHRARDFDIPPAGIASVLACTGSELTRIQAGDGVEVLESVVNFVRRFVAYPSEEASIAHALWIAHTHLMDVWDSTPRLAFLSPEPGSGKTRALEVSELLVPRPIEAINATPAYLFRKVSDPSGSPTILFDEIDTIFGPKAKNNEEIRGMLNAGHRRGAMAGRCVVKGKEILTEELPAYCAVAVAGLGVLPDTILTRSVVIRMRRRAPGESIEPFRRRTYVAEGHQLRDQLNAWCATIRCKVGGTVSNMPAGVEDRNADVWEALLAIADAAGGDWPNKARATAVKLIAQARESGHSLGLRLLADVKVVIGHRGSMATTDIVARLCELEEAPWGDLKGRPLDSRKLASLLRPYGISSKSVRFGSSVTRGYEKEAFVDSWTRYLPECASSSEAATGVTDRPEAAIESNLADVADVAQLQQHGDEEASEWEVV